MKKIVVLCFLALVVTAKETKEENAKDKKKDKRSSFYGYGDYAAGVFPLQGPVAYQPVIPQAPQFLQVQPYGPVPHHVHRPVLGVLPPPPLIQRQIPIVVPHHVHVPHAVAQPIPVPVDRHVPVPVPHPVPYPVHVVKPVAVPVDRPVAVPVDRPVAVPYPVLRHVPYPVDRPVAVPVLRNVPYPVPHPVPVDRPVAVPVDRPVAVPVDRPYPVPVDRPFAVPLPFPQPVAPAGVPVVIENSFQKPNSILPPNQPGVANIPDQRFFTNGGLDGQGSNPKLIPNTPNLEVPPAVSPPYNYPRPGHGLHTHHRIITHHYKPVHEHIHEYPPHYRHNTWK